MPYYSPERKAALLKMLLPPLNLSMAEVSRGEGVSEMSLSNWRKQVSSEGSAVPENTPSAQNWTAETKFAVVLEVSGLSEIELGEYCRRKAFTPHRSRRGDKPSSAVRSRKKRDPKMTASKPARTRNASSNLSVNYAVKTRRWLKLPRCWCCEKSSTITGGSTTRRVDDSAATAIARDLVI